VSVLAAYTRLRQHDHAEQRLLWRTGILFIVSHIYLRTSSFEKARGGLARAARRLHIRAQNAEQLRWLIGAVNRNLPGKHSCLVDALCCEAIANNSGLSTELKLGAARGSERVHFHAWVEHAGTIIAGEHDGEFTPLR
jgi:hypothetical protein